MPGVKFLIVALVGVGSSVLAGVWIGRQVTDRVEGALPVQANARLIGYASVVLLIPLGAEVVTGVRPGIVAHAMIGFLLVPPLVLKLGSVGYRFVRYYGGDVIYRRAGAPVPVLRWLAPALVVLTVVLFASGIELWLFGFRYGEQWATLHKAAFVLWFLAITVHVVAYLRRSAALTVADWRAHLPGAVSRQSLILVGLGLGVALLIAMLPFKSPFLFAPGAG
jgi:hypothetical protein